MLANTPKAATTERGPPGQRRRYVWHRTHAEPRRSVALHITW